MAPEMVPHLSSYFWLLARDRIIACRVIWLVCSQQPGSVVGLPCGYETKPFLFRYVIYMEGRADGVHTALVALLSQREPGREEALHSLVLYCCAFCDQERIV